MLKHGYSFFVFQIEMSALTHKIFQGLVFACYKIVSEAGLLLEIGSLRRIDTENFLMQANVAIGDAKKSPFVSLFSVAVLIKLCKHALIISREHLLFVP